MADGMTKDKWNNMNRKHTGLSFVNYQAKLNRLFYKNIAAKSHSFRCVDTWLLFVISLDFGYIFQ